MKFKNLFFLVGISFILCGCDVVEGKDAIIAELKLHDNTSPYTYEEVYESNNGDNVNKFSYNESTKKFTCSNYNSTDKAGISVQCSVTITWIWEYLEDAEIKAEYITSNGSYIVRMNISDFSFSQFPYIDPDCDYDITFMFDNTPASTISTAKAYARLGIASALDFANDFCTSIDGSLSIR